MLTRLGNLWFSCFNELLNHWCLAIWDQQFLFKFYHFWLLFVEATKGPAGVLRRCLEEYLKVKVWIRSHRFVRGFCIGYLVAFDRHWNLVNIFQNLIDFDLIVMNWYTKDLGQYIMNWYTNDLSLQEFLWYSHDPNYAVLISPIQVSLNYCNVCHLKLPTWQ